MIEQFPYEPSGQTSKGTLSIGPQPFWHLDLVSWKTILPWTRVEGMVWLLHTLFLLLHQLHLRSLGTRSQKLGTPGLQNTL